MKSPPAESVYADGQSAFEAKNYERAISLLLPLARAGHVEAQWLVGRMFQQGCGIARDPAEALRWYRRCAKQGHSEAPVSIGYLYEHGLGVDPNHVKAALWYRKGTALDNPRAYLAYGLIHLKGQYGLRADPAKALLWIGKSADRGEADAQHALGQLHAQGTGVAQDAVEAARWYQLAAARGCTPAMVDLGKAYADATGVTQDLDAARTWLSRAAELRNADAMLALKALDRRLAAQATSKDYQKFPHRA